MKIEIIKKIKSLPPLNETALDVIEFNKKDVKDSDEFKRMRESFDDFEKNMFDF
jgi:hypothetical protein